MSEEMLIPRYLQKHVKVNKSLDRLALRVFRKGGSSVTVRNYLEDVLYFCKWLKLSPDQAIKSRYDWPAMLNEYLDYVIVKQRGARSSAAKYSAAVKKWLIINEIEANWKRVEIPKKWRVETDEIPTRQQLKKIFGGSGLGERTFGLIAATSGLRMSTVISLQMKHIDLEREIPSIKIPPEITKNRRSYATFVTPETKEVLKTYLKERQLRGEVITPESYVVAGDRPKGRRISKGAATRRWKRMLRRVELAVKGDNQKWFLLHFHTLRKFFKSWSSLSGVNSDVVEFFMGHRASVAQVYFIPNASNLQPEIMARLEAEYRKALPALTIMSEAEKVKELEESLEKQREEIGRMKEEAEGGNQRFRDNISEIKSLKRQMERMKRQLDELLSRS